MALSMYHFAARAKYLQLAVCIILVLAYIVYTRSVHGTRHQGTSVDQNDDCCAIVTLTRKGNIHRLYNMLASVQKFYSKQYPVIVFHDDFTKDDMKVIRNCSDLNLEFVTIDLAKLTLDKSNVTRKQAERWVQGLDGGVKTRVGQGLGYRMMCQFWGQAVYHHPALQRYKYILRMDDDSYFTRPVKDDFFKIMENNKLDYAYRSWFTETDLITNLWNLTEDFLRIHKDHPETLINKAPFSLVKDGKYNGRAFFNNFFVTRLDFWKNALSQSYLKHVVENHGFFKYYQGDANVQTFALALAIHPERIRRLSFGYTHRCVLHGDTDEKINACQYDSKWMNSLKCRHIKVLKRNGDIQSVRV